MQDDRPGADSLAAEPYRIARPAVPGAPALFASPHSGRHYPDDMRASPSLDALALRRSEDPLVDDLIAGAVERGFTVIKAVHGRAYLDLNRAPDEIDGEMLADASADLPRRRTAKVAAGLGVAPRLCADGREIYDRRLDAAELRGRIERVHRPWHETVGRLLEDTRERTGGALLIDWHSMPSAAALDPATGTGVDMVLGDRYGGSCGPQVTAWLEAALGAEGFSVTRNAPYAGGYGVERHGRPDAGVHAIQVEINRALYLEEATLRPGADYDAFAERLARVFVRLAIADWPALLHCA